MAYYTTYWPADWAKAILKNGDKGPLEVIYGGPHRSQPPLGKVTIGDVVFPLTLSEGQLFILGRMTISNILNADDYTNKHLKIIRKTFMWDSYTGDNWDTITHRIPRTCADDAATGTDGTALSLRLIPADKIHLIKLGPKSGSEQSLKMREKNISINNFSGYFRRLSEESAKLFDSIV